MKRASISEAKNALSALLDRVKSGASILIMDRGRPVARLEPVGDLADGTDALSQLIRTGVVRAGRGSIPRAILTSPPPSPRKGASALRALIDERREGR
jgi:prevent-host-death family protein